MKFGPLVIAICLGLTSSLTNGNEPEASSILEASGKFVNQLKEYQTVSEAEASRGRYVSTVSTRIEADGFALSRTEIEFYDKKGNLVTKSVSIQNRKGDWEITKKHALLLKYSMDLDKKNAQAVAEIDRPKDQMKDQYSIDQVSFKNEPCYKITRTLSSQAIKISKRLFKEQISSNKDYALLKPSADAYLPTKVVYLIRKKDLFPMSKTSYSIKGDILDTYSRSAVRTNIALDPKTFEIPQELLRIVISSSAEHDKYTKDE